MVPSSALLVVVAIPCLFAGTSSQRSRNRHYDDAYDSKDYSYHDSYDSSEQTNQRHDPYRQRPSRPPSAHLQTNDVKLLHLDEDDVCRRSYSPTEPEYVCRNVKKCIGPVTEAIKYGFYLDVCSFDGTQLVVCCPFVRDMAVIAPNTGNRPTTGSTKPTKGTRPTIKWTQPTTKIWTPTTPHSKSPTRATRPTTKGKTTAAPPTKKQPTRVTRPQTVQGTTTTTAPEDNRFQNVNIAAEKCRQYNKLLPKSYYASDAVGDGTEAKPLEFPHMALLGYGETTESRDDWRCGGSLINERWILTAANCMYRSGSIVRWVRLGDFDVESTLDFAQPKDYRIVNHVLHPDYTRSERYNDIALFQLDADVEFSAFVRPICLNSDPSLNPSPQIVTGWGSISTDGGYSDTLLKVTLDIVPTKQCNASYYPNDDLQLKLGITEDSMICAGATTENEDACQGFSGGPLQTKDSQTNTLTYIQFGITSFGSSFCGIKESPGVYTRVAKYVPWIEKTIW